MKKNYITPSIEQVVLNTLDVIAVSGGSVSIGDIVDDFVSMPKDF